MMARISPRISRCSRQRYANTPATAGRWRRRQVEGHVEGQLNGRGGVVGLRQVKRQGVCASGQPAGAAAVVTHAHLRLPPLIR